MTKINKKKIILAILVAIITSIFLLLLFGVVTSIIPTRFFTRMTSVGWLEYTSLFMVSLLFGIYISLVYYERKMKSIKCNATAATGGVFGFLTFGCSICNKILVFFLGVAGVLAYFEPIRPLLGILSVSFLGFAIFNKAKNNKN